MPAITVAMITLNEEAAVAKVIGDIQRAVSGLDTEILVVDSSRDRTPEIAAAMGARVIRQFPPQGYGRAMMRALTDARGKVVITLDCDDTYPPDRISQFATAVLSGQADLVNASRLGTRPESMPYANYLANRFFSLLARIVLGVKTSDVHSGMRAYRRSMFQHVTFDAAGAALPVELLLKPALLGYRIAEVFIPYRERIGVTTLRRWESTVWTLKRILRLLPLRFQSHCREQTVGETG
ncbi:MAG TPA: glycosyltransferase family 2 protein [Bryobacteraceae bacterium]|nr:glycosyltransferase family 2 protein [Bryobacteraceae bacterium]